MQVGCLRIGHRGAAGTVPEHTALSFDEAVALGVDMIELDVQLSSDGELVVIHDSTLERTTNGSGNVRDHTILSLKSLDAGSWFDQVYEGQRILTLPEVISRLPRSVRLNVEIKGVAEDWFGIAARLSYVLDDTGRVESTIVSSFHSGALRRLRAADRRIPIGLLTFDAEFCETWELATELGAFSVHPYYPLVSEALVGAAHERGLAVMPWTVNDDEAIRALGAMRVDGIISDFPGRLPRA